MHIGGEQASTANLGWFSEGIVSKAKAEKKVKKRERRAKQGWGKGGRKAGKRGGGRHIEEGRKLRSGRVRRKRGCFRW